MSLLSPLLGVPLSVAVADAQISSHTGIIVVGAAVVVGRVLLPRPVV